MLSFVTNITKRVKTAVQEKFIVQEAAHMLCQVFRVV